MKKNILKFNTIVISIICLALLTACSCSKQEKSNNEPEKSYKTLTVKSSAMRPTLDVGDVINYDIITENTQLEKHDIVIYSVNSDSNGEKELYVSRIIEINTDSDGNVISYITKCDRNSNPDKPILPDDIVGIYVSTKNHKSN